MGRTGSTYVGEERCIQGFGGETCENDTTWEDPSVDSKILLKRTFKKQCRRG
jgi:hypothetical protein